MPLCECLCSEFSLAQQKRTKAGLGPILAGQRGSAHKERTKLFGFIREKQITQATRSNTEKPLTLQPRETITFKRTRTKTLNSYINSLNLWPMCTYV